MVATEGHQGLHQQQGLTELQERHTLLPLLLAQPTPAVNPVTTDGCVVVTKVSSSGMIVWSINTYTFQNPVGLW